MRKNHFALSLFLAVAVSTLGCATAEERFAMRSVKKYCRERYSEMPERIVLKGKMEMYWAVEIGPESHATTVLVDPDSGEIVKVYPGF